MVFTVSLQFPIRVISISQSIVYANQERRCQLGTVAAVSGADDDKSCNWKQVVADRKPPGSQENERDQEDHQGQGKEPT
jgi:hypothetical protein